MTVVSGHIIQEGSPVTVSEVSEVLGTSVRSVTGLCRSESINRYARFKPYAFGGILPDGITRQIISAANFGTAPKPLDFSQLPTAGEPTSITLDAVEQAWEQWRPPSGKSADNEPCRIGDFLGYDHLAKADIGSVEFGNKWDSTSPQALRDGWLRATVRFAEGEDFRVFLSDFTYGGTELQDMYLTILVIKCYHTSATGREWTRRYFAAQSQSPLRALRPSGSASVDIDLSGVPDTVIDAFGLNSDGSISTDHVVAVGLAPRMPGLADGFGTPQLIDAGGSLPSLVSLNMYAAPTGSVRYRAMLGTAESSGVADKEFFDVSGYITVSQGTAYGRTTAAWATVGGRRGVTVNVGGRFALFPSTAAQTDYGDKGRFKIGIVAVVTGSDGSAVWADDRVIITPAGMREYVIDVRNSAVGDITVDGVKVGSGPMNGAVDATLQPLEDSIFIPFDDTSATVMVYCYTEGYPTGDMYGKQYWPQLTDRGEGGTGWSVDLYEETITDN